MTTSDLVHPGPIHADPIHTGPIHTLLIANRGEIALRVLRTARELGIASVAIFTAPDAEAPHVAAADRAVEVTSYLDIDAVVAASLAVGADAVHPGYGFLSERAAFADALETAGVRLVGPSATVMRQLGRKDAARELAVAAGVPVVPRGEDAGFPVLVKAAAGGGGKGMRVVRRAEDLDEAVGAARREAATAFGDDTILIEKYVQSGRHIEVQVMGDAHGLVLHLGERDCSTQRRHQKVLEEAPAPTLDADTQARVRTAAVALAQHVGYTSAGTVEFLLDNDTGEFYFLEMNTRIQVEHPVTEAVTGLDLVELQLRAAAGEPLGVAQEDITLTGHAIEARVYAEDAFGGFLPQAGTAGLVRWPTASATVRVDQALESGQQVSTGFDPMLGKIIVHGPDRESARHGLASALAETAVHGLTTNTGFLRALAETPEFQAAEIDTAWLDTATIEAPQSQIPRLVAGWLHAHLGSRTSGTGPFRGDGWRIGGTTAPWRVVLDDHELLVTAEAVEESGDRVPVRLLAHRVLADGRDRRVPATHEVALLLADRRVEATVVLGRDVIEVVADGQRHLLRHARPTGQGDAESGDGALSSPMPGTVLQVRCQPGQSVVADQVLAVLEAMKMEMSIRAPFDGVVARVAVSVGDQVQLGALLLEVTAETDGAGLESELAEEVA